MGDFSWACQLGLVGLRRPHVAASVALVEAMGQAGENGRGNGRVEGKAGVNPDKISNRAETWIEEEW
jgi:hypothetical protein